MGVNLWKIMCMCIFSLLARKLWLYKRLHFQFTRPSIVDFSLARRFKVPRLYDAVCFYALLLHHHVRTLCIVCRIGSECFYTMPALIFEEFALSHT